MRRGSTLYYLHGDHLGSTALTTTGSGTGVSQTYCAYGKKRSGTTCASGNALATDRQFTGQKYDVTGLHYYNARYFDDHIGQFVSPDSMVPDASNLISWNRFAYAADNPLRYSDPTGHDIWDALTTVVDFAQGVGAQVGYNNTSLIPAQIHSQAPQAGESAAMQTGRFLGNVVSMVQGVAEVTFGAGVDAGGGGLCLTGVGCLAGAPAIVAGTAVIAHGGATATSGAVGAGQQLGNLYNSVMGEGNGSAKGVDWTPHGYKHFPQRFKTWKQILKGTANGGAAKYKPGIDIESLERGVWDSGTPTTNGRTWKVQEFADIIGATNGKESRWIRVEYSGGTIHGHPISQAEYLELLQ